MSSILYMLALLGIAIVVVWSVKNDKIPDDKPTVGLLAMKHDPESENNE